ncbi:MAG: hypothetical protein ABWX67_11990 [Allosphingosinicella sp.]
MGKSVMMLALGAALLVPSAVAADAAGPKRAAEAIPPPPPGMGQVVFYRKPRMGTLIGCRINEGFDIVNRLPPGKYFVHPTTPGLHEFEIRSDLLRVEVKAGETQFVRCTIVVAGVADLSLRNREDFDRYVRALDLQPPWTGERDEDD